MLGTPDNPEPIAAQSRANWTDALVVLIGAAVMFVLWYSKFSNAGLWYDELQSVTFAGRPLPTALFSAIVYDPHPPLYYLFLHYWMSLFGQSDRLILASSLFLIALTGIAVNVHCRRYFDRATATIATILFLVHPYAFYWSGQARMYAAVMLFAVLFQHANAGYFLAADGRTHWRPLVWVVICGAALSCLHNCGILFWGTVALYWLLRVRIDPAQRASVKRLKSWLVAQGCVLIISLPFVLHSLLEHLLAPERPNLAALAAAIASMTIGPERLPEALIVLGTVTTALVLVAAARSAELRLAGGILVVLPILSFWFISNLLKPIWVSDRLFAFVVPFFCIIAARVLTRARAAGSRAAQTSRLKMGGVAFATGIMLISCVIAGDRQILEAYVKPTDWRGATALVRSYAPDGGTVEVDRLRDRWSLNWYLIGPGWDEGIQAALMAAMREPGSGKIIERLVSIRNAMERYETEKSRGKYVIEVGLSEHREPDRPVIVFTNFCPASEFWDIYVRDLKREPQPGFLTTYEPLPPVKGLCGYVRRPVPGGGPG
jgi:hypothetical protein